MVRAVRARPWLLATAFAVAVLPACSLLIDTDASQCRRDADCARFGAATCDLATHFCAATLNSGGAGGGGPTGTGGAGGGGPSLCHDPSGCHPCAVGGAAVILNACTDSSCIRFDNADRLTNLDPNGNLKPLP
jgi:hypothetical protein